MGLVRSTAHAITIRQYGAPEVLTYASAPVPALRPDEVRIRTIPAAINHTDLEAEIRRSLFPTSRHCRAVLPAIVQAGGGTIVNVSSVAKRGINRVPYAAAKGGVNAITACLTVEYAEHGIRVCDVLRAAPRRRHGAFRAAQPSEQEARWYQRVVDQTVSSKLIKRYGPTGEQAAAILFPASDEASYITGVTFSVAGGDIG